jgi:DNA polymerase I
MADQLSFLDHENEDETSAALATASARWATAASPGEPVQQSLFDEVIEMGPLMPEVPLPPGCRIVDEEAGVCGVAQQLAAAGTFAFDTETDSLDVMIANPVGISLSWHAGEAVYIPIAAPDGSGAGLAAATVAAALRSVFGDPAVGKVGHNLKYDVRVMERMGVVTRNLAFDTYIATTLLEAGEDHGLKDVARRILGVAMTDYNSLTRSVGRSRRRIPLRQLPVSVVATYACADAEVTYRLYDHFRPRVAAGDMERVFDLEMALIPIVAAMETAGVRLDVGYLNGLKHQMSGQVQALATEICTLAGVQFNLNSTVQLGDVLFNRLGLPRIKETRTGSSTDESVLRALATQHPLPARVLEYRELTKLVSTYVEGLSASVNPITGRVHPSFRQLGAVSGRFSCTEPNLQNLPKDSANTIRRAFVAEPGTMLLSADYSQVELRILAHYTGEPALRDSFARGEDVHRRTASEIFGVALDEVTQEQRRVAKQVVFGLAYGMSSMGLAAQLGMPVDEAQSYIDRFFARYPGVRRFMVETVKEATRTGVVTTLLGRRREMPGLRSPDARTRGGAERAAINHPIQGTAADILKLAMVRLAPQLEGYRARLLLQVHDELVLEVAEPDLDFVRQIVVNVMEEKPFPDFSVPLTVETKVGATWS